MSKKKNTLNDLDEFLKQQASSLVAPTSLKETIKTQEKEIPQDASVTEQKIIDDLKVLAQQEGDGFRTKFYDLILHTMETQPHSTQEDKMLINTALYLKHGKNWKDAIRQYWKSR